MNKNGFAISMASLSWLLAATPAYSDYMKLTCVGDWEHTSGLVGHEETTTVERGAGVFVEIDFVNHLIRGVNGSDVKRFDDEEVMWETNSGLTDTPGGIAPKGTTIREESHEFYRRDGIYHVTKSFVVVREYRKFDTFTGMCQKYVNPAPKF